MIELNLLPDVKLSYIKAQRTQRLVLALSVLVTIGAVVLLALLLAFGGLEKKHLSDLSKDITNSGNKLKDEPQISKILTVQNQLESLTALHAGKPQASKLFTYLNQVTPVGVSISNFSIDFTQQTATMNGTADSIGAINKYVDTLKFTTYRTNDTSSSQSLPAFSNVVLASFGFAGGSSQTSSKASYSITLAYDKNIFDITKDAKLSVPSITTTRAGLDSSNDLFEKAPATTSTTSAGGTQ